ncbi:hypothetical protein IFM89_001625 [Coptis chinensis]|uniref:NAC domain-containing protein n=1 Tax=Coptis chinensis TaxID=261450 RepID=A0A835LQB7_9MAGN|nr:hypothetical protein IFM89_001625 [Coptis chinensis]
MKKKAEVMAKSQKTQSKVPKGGATSKGPKLGGGDGKRRATKRSKWQGRKKNTLYFFTPRHRQFPLALRRVHAAGEGGFWKITGSSSKIYGKDGNVGYKKPFGFYRGRHGRDERTDWIMHEYIVQRGSGMVVDNMVLCKIAKDDAESRRNYNSVRDLLKRLKM